MSMSDLDIDIQSYHAGELSEQESATLTATLTHIGASNLLDRDTYERLVSE